MSEYIYEEVIVEQRDYGAFKTEIVGTGYRREKIVRCRDCVHFDSGSPLPICELLEFGAADQADKGFCAWGESVG